MLKKVACAAGSALFLPLYLLSGGNEAHADELPQQPDQVTSSSSMPPQIPKTGSSSSRIGLSESDVEKIRLELNKSFKYPSDAEEIQRGLEMVEPVATPQCVYDQEIVQESANKGALIGLAKGVGKVAGETSLAIIQKRPVVIATTLKNMAKEISKEASKGYASGFTKGHQEAINELHQCQSVAVKEAAEQIVTKLYLYSHQQQKAVEIIAKEIEKVNEHQHKPKFSSP